MTFGFSRRRASVDDPMPLRTRQQELEDASRRAFEGILPDRLVFRALDHDYGIDGEVEEFEGGRATGLRFYVQLKATDEGDLKVPVKLSTAGYFRAQPVPVLMIRYVASTKTLYARWFHQFDPYYEHVGDQQLTFHWNRDRDVLDHESAARLLDEAAAVMEAKASNLQLPIRAALSVAGGSMFGFSPAELELGLRAGAKRCPDLVEVVRPDEEHLLSLTLSEEQMSANVAGLASVTIHFDEYPGSDRDLADIGAELLACASVALARAGHADVASRIAVHFFAKSLLAHIPPMSMDVAEAMAYSARGAEALEMAEQLDDMEDENLKLASFSFLLAALRRGARLNAAEQQRLVETMEARIDRRQKNESFTGAAGESVGLGNFYKSTRNFEAAVEAYQRALELDPEYESREHFWLELAGAYFHAGQFPASADAYGRALALSEDPAWEIEACRADALMHAGQYEEAYQLFAPIAADETHLGAWAATKAAALGWVIVTTGVTSQDRDSERATQIAGRFADRTLSETEVDQVSTEIWSLDAVSPLGWFNLARDYLDHEQHESGMYAYLVTAVMQEGDVEAWANVASLALGLGEESLAAAAIVTAAKLNGERYLVELARLSRINLPDEESREEFLTGVNEMLEQVLPHEPEGKFEVRFVSKGRPVESVHLPPPGHRP